MEKGNAITFIVAEKFGKDHETIKKNFPFPGQRSHIMRPFAFPLIHQNRRALNLPTYQPFLHFSTGRTVSYQRGYFFLL